MATVLGIPAGVYPSVDTTRTLLNFNSIQFYSYNYNGTNVPQIALTNSINVTCSLVNASTLSPIAGQVIYTFSPTSGSGTQIQEKPHVPQFIPITGGQYNQITIQLLDDHFLPLNNLDPSISATLLIRHRPRNA
jgi:hypothetical protein